MYDQFIRNNMPNRLQADLRSTMRSYNDDKARLSYQLSNLHVVHAERTNTDLSMASSKDFSSSISLNTSPRRSNYFRSPNFIAGSSNTSLSSGFTQNDSQTNPKDKKWKERKDPFGDKFKKEKDLLKLPVIHSASTKRSEWESGKFLQTSKRGNFTDLEPMPGINAARALLSESMKIPSIYDPQRTDTAFDTGKKKTLKKVTFADDHHGSLLSITQIEPNENNGKNHSKNTSVKGPVPTLKLKANSFSHVSRPKRPKKTSLLPPITISPFEVQHHPERVTEGVNHWKAVYSNMVDPEEKTRALADILSALRLKKYENEMAMKYGDQPRPKEQEDLMKDFLSLNASNNRTTYRDEQGHTRRGIIPLSRCSSVSRLSTGHPNTAQLQNYLKQLSKSRRYLDSIHSDKFSDTASSHNQIGPTPIPVNA